MSAMQARYDAVMQFMDAVKSKVGNGKPSREDLESIGAALHGLAQRKELFPPEEFTVDADRLACDFRLAEDRDHRFALYASASRPNRATPPHNHETWAIIASVRGLMRNSIFQRIDNQEEDGVGRLELLREVDVAGDEYVCFTGDDFHAIEVFGPDETLHLHLYGDALDHQPNRIRFSDREGGAYRIYEAPPHISTPKIAPRALARLLQRPGEIAVVDVREIEEFSSEGHLLAAVSLPESQIEIRASALMPRRDVPVIVTDADGGPLAVAASRRLFELGWKNISILDGGVAAWAESGGEVFQGIGVLSKAFGEAVEQTRATPRISAPELKAKMDSGAPVVVVDCRPTSEFAARTIPGAYNAPGVDIVSAKAALEAHPEASVVVTCAGRTRGLLSTEWLRDMGLANPVAVLEDGISGWRLAGFDTASGAEARRLEGGAVTPAGRLPDGVHAIDRESLAALEADTSRTLYRFDVRGPDEFAAGHLPGFRSAPGGQLLQASDAFMAVRGARIVLADDDGARAPLTAAWLVQMGVGDVFVIRFDPSAPGMHVGRELPPVLEPVDIDTIAPAALREALAAGTVTLFDVASSDDYRAGHIPGAAWALRNRLGDVPGDGSVVVTSRDGILAGYTVDDLARRGIPARALAGGTAAWVAEGGDLEEGATTMLHPAVDIWRSPGDRPDAKAAMRAYLDWERRLPEQIARDGSTRFNIKS
ncbi:rhodanese-like domain-containing protein [Acuticoccus kandeliae]|uniref:rhodanese-like domain-containing protein n=1 Tax=Acuticoccus kandeliae TaxID=2073160 RepID=UPI0014761C4B|nr:rhodanese-like domain-containing protein [Acuticoccus kandeliae]